MASVLLVLIAGGPVGATPNGGRRSLFELPNCKGSIEVREEGDLPSASEFARLYQDSDRGFGKPVIFKGAAKQMPAMTERMAHVVISTSPTSGHDMFWQPNILKNQPHTMAR